jgi:hypothetical protein
MYSGSTIHEPGLKLQGSGFGVQLLELRVSGQGYGVWGLEFRI